MITIGETYLSDEYVVENPETGQPENVTVTVTVHLPNGSTDSPTPTNEETGVYSFGYGTVLAGRHPFTVLATGGFLGSTVLVLGEDVFNVDDASTAAALVGLRETKEHLGIRASVTEHDEELRRVIVTASDLVERETRLWHRATVVEQFSPSRTLVLSSLPVVSVTSIDQQGSTIDPAGFEVSAEGILQPLYTAWPWGLAWGNTNRITVTYEAGETFVPTPVREAVLHTVAELWESQQGPAALPLQGGGDEEQAPLRLDAIPPAAMRLLGPWLRVAGFA